jgi:hypothetical protein
MWGRHGALLRRSGSLPNVTEWMRIAAEQRGVKRATYEESLGKGPTTPTGDRGTKILPRPTVALKALWLCPVWWSGAPAMGRR